LKAQFLVVSSKAMSAIREICYIRLQHTILENHFRELPNCTLEGLRLGLWCNKAGSFLHPWQQDFF
jgi:hypothetical protein